MAERDYGLGRLGGGSESGSVFGARQLQASIDALSRTVDMITRALSGLGPKIQPLGDAMKSGAGKAQTANVVAGDLWHGTRNWSGWGTNGGGARFSTPVRGAAGSPAAPGDAYDQWVLGGSRPNGGGASGGGGGRQGGGKGNGGLVSFGGKALGLATSAKALGAFTQSHMGDWVTMDTYGQYMALGQAGNYTRNRDRSINFLYGHNGRSGFLGALSSDDAAAFGMQMAQTTGMYGGAGLQNAMYGAAGFGFANPSAGLAGASAAYANAHTFQANAVMRAYGIGPTLLGRGRQASMGAIANNVLQATLRAGGNGGRSLTQAQFAAMSSQNGSLTYNLNKLVASGAIDSDTAQSMTMYLKAQTAATANGGMSAATFEDLMNKASTGDRGARQILQRYGIDQSAFEKMRDLDSTRRTNTADQMHGFVRGLSDATNTLEKFDRVLNHIMTATGLNGVLGTVAGVGSQTGGVANGIKNALAMATPIGAVGSMLSGLGGGGAGGPQATGGTGAYGSGSGHTASDAIRVAMQYLGKPYQWGGNNPQTSFDCSGLMQWAYGQIGVNLPRTAAQQENAGSEVAKNQVRPGDLIFFGEPAHHVGMYVGDGKMIEAPHTGANIQIAGDNIGAASHVRRILGQAGTYSGGSGGGSQYGMQSSANGYGGDSGSFGMGSATYGSVEEAVAVMAHLSGMGGAVGTPGGWQGRTVAARATGSGANGGNNNSNVGSSNGSAAQNRALGKRLAAAMGWTGSEWNALDWIWNRESSWNNRAQNPTSTAYGIAQFLDSTWGDYGFKKTSDPATQIRAGLAYIKGRYGDPINAQSFWQKHNWYDQGSGVQGVKGDQYAKVHDGEIVLNKRDSDLVRAVLRTGTGGEPAKPFPEQRGKSLGAAGGSGNGSVTVIVQPGAIKIAMANASMQEVSKAARAIVDKIAEDARLTAIAGA